MKKVIALLLVLVIGLALCGCGAKPINVGEILSSGGWYSTFDNSSLSFNDYGNHGSGDLDLGTGVSLAIFENKFIDWELIEDSSFQITFDGTEFSEKEPYVFEVENISKSKKEPVYIIREVAEPACIYLLSPHTEEWEVYYDYIGEEGTVEADAEGNTFGGAVGKFRNENEKFLENERALEEELNDNKEIERQLELIEEGRKMLEKWN